MPWHHYLSFFFSGALLANAVPHLVSGMQGRAFQSPFAKPRGVGLSSATVNVLWGAFNLLFCYGLLYRAGDFDLHNPAHVLVAALGGVLMAVFAARHFGRFHGGNLPRE